MDRRFSSPQTWKRLVHLGYVICWPMQCEVLLRAVSDIYICVLYELVSDLLFRYRGATKGHAYVDSVG